MRIVEIKKNKNRSGPRFFSFQIFFTFSTIYIYIMLHSCTQMQREYLTWIWFQWYDLDPFRCNFFFETRSIAAKFDTIDRGLVPRKGTCGCCGTPCIIMSPLSAAFEPHGSDIGCSRIDLYARRCTRPRPRPRSRPSASSSPASKRQPSRLALEDAIE